MKSEPCNTLLKWQTFKTLCHICTHREQNWEKAAKWYSRALETPSGASDATDTSCQATESANPDYIITARLAEMFRSGGHRLEKDPNKAGELYTQSAEVAMEMMKGKLANKYYMLAEEAWSEVGDGGETWLVKVSLHL